MKPDTSAVESRGRANAQRGVSLIEVLVAVVVLSIGLLGIASLQSSALTNNTLSYQFSIATSLAQSMAERMQANRAGMLNKDYSYAATSSAPSAPSADCSSSVCSSTEQAAWDIAAWYSQVTGTQIDNVPVPSQSNSSGTTYTALLPNSAVSITQDGCDASVCTTGSAFIVTVYWSPDGQGDKSKITSCNPAEDQLYRCVQMVVSP